MELWDVYNIDRIKTDDTVERGAKMLPGQYHVVVHAIIFNSKGEMLIQKRTASKDTWPLKWDLSVGGSALAGENTREACERETLEELGLVIDLNGCRPVLTLNFSPGFDDYYLIREDIDIDKLVLQEEEVCGAMWASKEKIIEMLDSGEFIPTLKNFIGFLFDLKEITSLKGVFKGYKNEELNK